MAGERSRVYVGEAEDLRTRLKQHTDKRDDWTEALVFTRKSNELNKAHVKYLESVLYDALRSADRYEVTNGNTPTRSSLHETDQYAMEDFAERVKLLTGVLGHPMFVDLAPAFLQPTAPEETELIFELGVPRTNLIARMRRTDEGYVVLKGSHARNSLVDSMKTASRNARQRLLDDGSLAEVDGQLVFQRNTLFNSPSAAGIAVTGRSTNGWTTWKSARGTLAEVYRVEGS